MPEGIPYSSQNVASAGKELNYVGSHCYAYSGSVDVSNTELFLLDFTSGKDYITAKVQVGSLNAENEDYVLKIYFNDVVIFGNTFHQQGATYVDIANFIPLIIPPLTGVKISLDNVADSDTRTWTVGLTGELH
jgi:hypothetical protein